jgi:pilus assembly protein CpaB
VRLSRTSVFGIAFAAAVFAAILLYAYWARYGQVRPAGAPPEPETASVVIAQKDIPAESVIAADAVTTTDLPADRVPRNAARDAFEVVGKVTNVVLPTGTVIELDKLAEPGPAQGLAWTVSPGMRAVTVALDPVSGVAGFLKPGNRVDVLATVPQGDTTVSLTVLQDVRLLAIGPQAQRTTEEEPKEGAPAGPRAQEQPTATLEVTPEGAQELVLADQKGDLRLALRAATDHVMTGTSSVTDWELTGLTPPAKSEAGEGPEQPQPTAASQTPPDWWKEPPAWWAGAPWRESEAPTRAGARVEVIRGTQHEVVNLDE